MGAPWGGLLTSAGDYCCFMQSFLFSGAVVVGQGGRVLGPKWASQMVTDQTTPMLSTSATSVGTTVTSGQSARAAVYGLGWKMHAGTDSAWGTYSMDTGIFGHGGATGATSFADPNSGISVVLLTTEPGLGSSGIVASVAVRVALLSQHFVVQLSNVTPRSLRTSQSCCSLRASGNFVDGSGR